MEVQRHIYLDYNATTPLEPQVIESIHDALLTAWGNPSSSHHQGQEAKKIISEARKAVASMVHGIPSDVVFTSGGTEANHLVLHTAVERYSRSVDGGPVRENVPHIVTSNLEHDSIRLPLENLQRAGKADVTFVAASPLTGRVEVSSVLAAIRPQTCLVTIMMANNETGIIQPIAAVCDQIRRLGRTNNNELPRILLHTDAAQAIGKVKVDAKELGVDYLTIVGHKFYGPRVGALYCRGLDADTTPLVPVFFGGGQERGYRPGTENTGMVAGLGTAARLVCNNLERYRRDMERVRDYLERQLQTTFGDKVKVNARYNGIERLPNTCSVSMLVPGLSGAALLARCRRVQASVGAACHSGAGPRASPVLVASGVSPAQALQTLRLSVGRHTTTENIDLAVADLKQAVEEVMSDREATSS